MAQLPPLPDGRWLTVDPGETVGWALWEGRNKIDGGQTPAWDFVDDVAYGLGIAGRPGAGLPAPTGMGRREWDVKLIVCEDFVNYPEGVGDGPVPPWDSFETPRVIGAITLCARLAGIPFELQGADIKRAAKAAGAEDIFVRPLHPNRHENDATMHGVWRCAQEGPWTP